MTQYYNIKIPSGTLIDINGSSVLLKKSIHAKTDGEKIILTNDTITTDMVTIDRRQISPMSIPKMNNGSLKNKIPHDLCTIAYNLLKDSKTSDDLKKLSETFLYNIINHFNNELEVDKKDEELEVPKPIGPIKKEK